MSDTTTGSRSASAPPGAGRPAPLPEVLHQITHVARSNRLDMAAVVSLNSVIFVEVTTPDDVLRWATTLQLPIPEPATCGVGITRTRITFAVTGWKVDVFHAQQSSAQPAPTDGERP